MTYRNAILQILKNPKTHLTCGEICKKLIKKLNIEEWKHRYLSGSISSILNKLVKEQHLRYHPLMRGPKGGYVYIKDITKKK